MKTLWRKPTVNTMNSESVKSSIVASACSNYDDFCRPASFHIESIPGNPPVKM